MTTCKIIIIIVFGAMIFPFMLAANAGIAEPNMSVSDGQKVGPNTPEALIHQHRARILSGPYGSAPITQVIQLLTEIPGGPEIQQIFQALAVRKKETLPIVKEKLRAGRVWEKHMLTKLLRYSPWPDVRAELVAIARDTNEHWLPRQGALYALGELGNPSAGPEVLVILSEPNCPTGVQLVAISTLARLGHRKAASTIKLFIGHDNVHVQLFAYRALAEFGESVDHQFLLSALENQNYIVRREACGALVPIQGDEITQKLQSVAEHDFHEAVRTAAKIGLLDRQIRGRTPSEKLRILRSYLKHAARRTAPWIIRTILDKCGPQGQAFVEQLSARDDKIGERARAFLIAKEASLSVSFPGQENKTDSNTEIKPLHAAVPTHQTLMEYAIGKAAGLETPLSFTSPQQTRMREGAQDEDNWDGIWPRFIDHGYNPLTNSGFVTEYGIGATARDTSVTRWNSMMNAFSNGQFDGGDGTGAWHYLGRVSHLLQDMSSPLHALGTYWHALGCQFENFWANNDSTLRSILNSVGGPLHSGDPLPSEATSRLDSFTQERLQYRYNNNCPNKNNDDVRGWIEVLAWITYFRATFWGEVTFGTSGNGTSGPATSSQTTGTTFTDGYVGPKTNVLNTMFNGDVMYIDGWTDNYYEITDRLGYVFRWMSYTDIDDWSSCGRNWANGYKDSSIRIGGSDDDDPGVRITGRFWFDTCELGKDTSGNYNRRCYPNRYPNGNSMTDDLHLYYGKYGYPLTVRYNAGLLGLANRRATVKTNYGQANGFTWGRKDNFGSGPSFNATSSGSHFYFVAKSQVDLTAPPTNTEGRSFVRWLKDGASYSTNRTITINTPSSQIPRAGVIYTAEYCVVSSAPTGVSATDGTYCDRIRISWNSVSGATGYEIWRNTTNDSGSASYLDDDNASPYDDYSATAGVTYYYWVKAKNSCGTSGFSSSDSGYRDTPPSLPSNFSDSSVTTDSITWTWQDNSNNEDEFRGHDPSHNVKWTASANTTSKTESGLSVNTQYTRHIHAYNACGDSSPSNSHSVYTTANPPGVALFSNVTESSVQANWTDNGNPPGTEYLCENVTRGTDSGWITETYWNETGLDCGTQYCYQVRARNGDEVETTSTNLGCETTLPCPAAEINIRQGTTDIPDDTGNYDFGTVLVGGSAPIVFTIENLGNTNLELTGSPIVEISGTHAGDFLVTQPPTTPVVPETSVTFEITFSPSAQGIRDAIVSISNNDSDENPYNYSITGTGNEDFYEPDDTFAQANWIYPDSPQTHSIVPSADVDWVKFSLDTESEVIIETSGASGNTRMWLYDDTISQIDFNDNGGIGEFSRIERVCDMNALSVGTYYAKIEESNNDDEILSYELTLTINSCIVICDANRTVPDYVEGLPVTVSIDVVPEASVMVYAVEDSPPTGWTVSDINEGGTWDDVNKKVKWGPFFDNSPRTLAYDITAPAGASGCYSLSGLASFDGVDQSVCGDTEICILHVTWDFDPNTYIPQSPVLICLDVTPEVSVMVYAVEDSPPTGWTVSDISEGGTWDDVNKKVKWGPFFDSTPRTLYYNATPPAGETEEKAFSGTASFDGVDESVDRTITDCSVTIGDFDNDCDVDWEDLAILIGNWLESY